MVADPSEIPAKLAAVQEKLRQAARRAGRSLADITLLAVTKNVPASRIQEAWRCGVRHMGENRVQEAASKRPALTTCQDVTWHLIGHLQSNKVKKAIELFDSIQSLDSLSLAEVIDREGEKRGRDVPCLVEIKVSEEPTKFGVLPGELERFLDGLERFRRLRIEGLMTIAPYFNEPEKTRPYFQKARALFDKFKTRFKAETPTLSMGMSQDFGIAVEEGSTMVRIGTALFGPRPAPATRQA